jgi:hypothetical protein
MKVSRDPLRWAESETDAPPELARDIHVLRAERASAAQLASLERRLAAELAAPTFAPASSTTLGLGSKTLIALTVSGAIGLLAWTAHLQREPIAAPAASPVPAPAVAAPAPPSRPEPARSDATLAPAPEVAPSSVVNPPRRRRLPPRPAEQPAVAAPTPESELALLRASQGALDSHPAGALELAEQHARDYPHGLFAQEREVLAIEALLKLKRKAAAVDRAARFMQSFPDSPHARRVRALLEHTPGQGTPGASTPHSADATVKE